MKKSQTHRHTYFSLLIGIFVAGFVQISAASPVLWILSGVVFDDGGTADGYFIYDVDIDDDDCFIFTRCFGTMISWDIKTSGGTLPSFHYSSSAPDNGAVATSDGNWLIFVIVTNPTTRARQDLRIKTISPLANLGGDLLLDFSYPTVTNLECNNCGNSRHIIGGSLTGTVISVRGDMNGDGLVNTADLLLLQRLILDYPIP